MSVGREGRESLRILYEIGFIKVASIREFCARSFVSTRAQEKRY